MAMILEPVPKPDIGNNPAHAPSHRY
jgi:hypothetical protein